MKKYFKKNKGYLLIQTLVFGSIAIFLLSALSGWATEDVKASRQAGNRELAIQIAEAGIDYYRWHLAHAPTDYQDGTGTTGPYLHDFFDKNGNTIGKFTLEITPPPVGSSLVTVKSTGEVNNTSIKRTIETRLAKPSMAKYAVVANSVMRFGVGTETFGPIHSNGGIRFDGLAHNIVSSGATTYDDPDHSGSYEYGVHTHLTPTDSLPPNELPTRSDIFIAGRQYSVPNVDFTGITADLAQLKISAQTTDGFWRTSSGAFGYHLVLKTNNTFDLYKITELVKPARSCSNSESGWGTWSIQNQTLIDNYSYPENGILFFEDNIWVDGQINNNRLTIVAAVLPDSSSTRKSITVNNNLLYTSYDGTDVIGLIAQNNINVGLQSANDLKIDAALIAQNGRVGRYYYSSGCSSYYIRQSITLWGMIATNLRYGFAYVDGTGYQERNLNYDSHLLYGPPPSFPLTSDQYVTLSWQEIKE